MRRLAGLAVPIASVVAVPLVSTTAVGLATPTTTTTTTPLVIVQPTTTRPLTTTTQPSRPARPSTAPTTTEPERTTRTTTTQPAAEIATTAVPVELVHPTAPTTAADVIAAAPPTTAAAQIAQAATTTVPQTSGEQTVLGELSTNPADWTDEVVEYLEQQDVDVDALGDSVVHDQPGGLLSNEGCAVQCITDGAVWAVGTGAHIRVVTAVPATISITLFGGNPAKATSPTSTTTWGHTWPYLNENQTYTALASATDAAGNQAFASGDFTTLSRFVSALFVGFEGQTQYPYEHFHFWAWANGTLLVQLEGDVDLPWGGSTFTSVPPTLELDILGAMHDHDDNSPFKFGVTTIQGAVTQTFELDTYPPTATYWTSHTIDTAMWTAGQPFPFETQIQIGVVYADPDDYP